MMKLVNDIKEANCITHGGTMHADEVFATAFLEMYLILSNYNKKTHSVFRMRFLKS